MYPRDWAGEMCQKMNFGTKSIYYLIDGDTSVITQHFISLHKERLRKVAQDVPRPQAEAAGSIDFREEASHER